jgi:hypothetical protein
MSNHNRKRKYTVLGGVIAPAESTYSIQGMPSPLLQKQVGPLDTSPPSLRFTGAVANLRNFNPYTMGVRSNINPVKPHESYKLDKQKARFTTTVQLHGKPAKSPVLGPRR